MGEKFGLYDPSVEHSDCGVGFITRKDGIPSADVIRRGDAALCAIPHRGGMSAEGVGDGAGVSIDLSVELFSALTGRELVPGGFGVANLFLPDDPAQEGAATALVERALAEQGLEVVLGREVPVDHSVAPPEARRYQLPIRQWVFLAGPGMDRPAADRAANAALLAIEAEAYTDPALAGLYPLSLSTRTQTLKGRLNAHEVIPFFLDLLDPRHSVRTLYFHTRFSTNTEPHPSMAQPFRMMAHNGELNTDRKNRLSDDTVARARSRSIVRPPGQSDSSRLDQSLQSRVLDDGLGIVEAVVTLMPPAWENDASLPAPVRDMLEYFSLYEEKNDGPAALIFSDGDVVGARLDRLGLRPLRTVETAELLCVSSEAGQLHAADDEVISRGRIEAGGMLYLDHRTGRIHRTREALEKLAAARDYAALLEQARVRIEDIDVEGIRRGEGTLGYAGDLALPGRYVAYSLNQESFRFMMDPMLATGAERISAMGYGNAINALSDQEGGMAKYFSQRFAQVTNPPLDSIREADGMSFRVALGAKPDGTAASADRPATRQIVVPSPILSHLDMVRLREQDAVPLSRFPILFAPDPADARRNAASLLASLDALCDQVEDFARAGGGIAVLTDREADSARAPLPLLLAIAAVNQRLIGAGLRLRVSLLAESGQLPSAHHIASALGFGASAVYSLSARLRAEEKHPSAPRPAEEGTEADLAFDRFRRAALKSLGKTMGRVGLCTVESYIGGEFFEPSYLDTADPVLARCFPHLDAPVGGVGLDRIALAAAQWHARSRLVQDENDIPLIGLFKERADGAGHSFGTTAVRGFGGMTDEPLALRAGAAAGASDPGASGDDRPGPDPLRLLTLGQLEDAFGLDDAAYENAGFEALPPEAIDAFRITPGYRAFVDETHAERDRRPSALRDVLALPADLTALSTVEEFARALGPVALSGNASITVQGLRILREDAAYRLRLATPDGAARAGAGPAPQPAAGREAVAQRHVELGRWFAAAFAGEARILAADVDGLLLTGTGRAGALLGLLAEAPAPIGLEAVQPAHEITRTLASGAMSHGALVASAHEAVAHGTNMVGGMSNCGEGGEHRSRYGTIRGSRIKQFASGRFGIWAGYLADPQLQELEIKIGQGAKPGEGGQLPAPKVTVDIAAARGGTPGVELVSPPPHHDTYSIEDLAQLIHDCKAARVRVVVKLVSSEGIGTIAVGVAKAGADVINVAGHTGGTGAAAVTSLKYAGRSAEIGVAEVHQALLVNGLRDKVTLRCSGAHQTGRDVVTSALLGGDSFEFGTTALMMLRCVMAKNCNIKCPAGLTTNPEAFDGDPRALAQYLLNIAHDVRTILARLGLRSLREARGRGDLLQLLDHPAAVGRLDVRAMLAPVPEKRIEDPVHLEKDYRTDDRMLAAFTEQIIDGRAPQLRIDDLVLATSDKSVGGQLAIDVERLLNHTLPAEQVDALPAVQRDDRGRASLRSGAVSVRSCGAAGQSFGAFLNDGMDLLHRGTANDGVGKSQCGGRIVVSSPGGGAPDERGGNVLIGNFALFGATGGRLFVAGEAGDRFAVRNSGATAVVEGFGDFGCEYMTNGAVLNIGGFGKGVGNGMSGGFLYQLDPEGALPGQASADSVQLLPLTAVGYHEDAAKLLLTWHHEATGSLLARRLLEDWESTRTRIVIAMPRALLLTQDAEQILAASARRELQDELSRQIARDRIRALKADLKQGTQVAGGRAPLGGAQGAADRIALLAASAVISSARDIARDRSAGITDPAAPRLETAARRLILTEDHFVMAKVITYVRRTLDALEDLELATLISASRLADYRTSLEQRNVRSIDAPGTFSWIADQERRNAERIDPARFDAVIATAALDDLVRSWRETQETPA